MKSRKAKKHGGYETQAQRATSEKGRVANGDGKGAAAATGFGVVKEGQNVAGTHDSGKYAVLAGDRARVEHCKSRKSVNGAAHFV